MAERELRDRLRRSFERDASARRVAAVRMDAARGGLLAPLALVASALVVAVALGSALGGLRDRQEGTELRSVSQPLPVSYPTATPLPPGACPLTLPEAGIAAPIPSSALPPLSSYAAEWFVHGGDGLWVLLPVDGSLYVTRSEVRFGWWREAQQRLAVRLRSLDGSIATFTTEIHGVPAPTLDSASRTAPAPPGGDGEGLEVGVIRFPATGCWEVVGSLEGAERLRFVVNVVDLAAPDAWFPREIGLPLLDEERELLELLEREGIPVLEIRTSRMASFFTETDEARWIRTRTAAFEAVFFQPAVAERIRIWYEAREGRYVYQFKNVEGEPVMDANRPFYLLVRGGTMVITDSAVIVSALTPEFVPAIGLTNVPTIRPMPSPGGTGN